MIGDVETAARNLLRSAGHIDDASLTAGEVPSQYLAGPTGQRAFDAVGKLRFAVDDISQALGHSAWQLTTWAATIDRYRKEFDEVHAEQDHMYKELAVVEPRRDLLRARGDEADYEELSQLDQRVGTLKRQIESDHQWAQDKHADYKEEAEKVGDSLYDDAFQSPAVSGRQRFIRDLLGISDGLGGVVDAAGWAGLVFAGVGAIGTKALSKGAKEGIDQLNDYAEKLLLAGVSGKISADATALAAGADVNLGEIVFDSLNLDGIGPLAKLKEETLDKITKSDDVRDVIYEAVGKAEDKLKAPAFPEPDPVKPNVPAEERWQGSDYA